MRVFLFSLFILVELLFSSVIHAQTWNKYPFDLTSNFQIVCAQQMLKHIKDPTERSLSLGLMAIDYVEIGNAHHANAVYADFLECYSQIADTNQRNEALLVLTNHISSVLDQEIKLTALNEALKDTAHLDLYNKISLAKLAVYTQEYELAYRLLFELDKTRKLYFRKERFMPWHPYRYFDDAIEDIIIFSVEDLTRSNEKDVFLKLDWLHKYVQFSGWSRGCRQYNHYVTNLAINLMVNDEFDKGLETLLNYIDEEEVVYAMMGIIDTLSVDHYMDAANKANLHLIEVVANDPKTFYDNFEYIQTQLKFGYVDEIKAMAAKESTPELKIKLHKEIAKHYFQNDNQEAALEEIDSALAIGPRINHPPRYTEEVLEIADLLWMNGFKEEAEEQLTLVKLLCVEQKDFYWVDARIQIDLVKQMARWGDYSLATDRANKFSNDGASSHCSDAIREIYTIAFEKGDSLEALKVLARAAERLSSISHPNQKNAFIEYTASKYVELGDYSKAMSLAGLFEHNRYHSILDFIKNFFLFYELNEQEQVPQAYYLKFIDLLKCNNEITDNYETYTFLFKAYEDASFSKKAFDFERLIEQDLLRYDFNDELVNRSNTNRIDLAFSEDILFFHLYCSTLNEKKLDALMERSFEKVRMQKYGWQDVVDLFGIEYKFNIFGGWQAKTSKGVNFRYLID